MISGWVKGSSMAPSLVHGDLLRTEPRLAGELRPGMICVFHPESGIPIVHRIVGIRNLKAFILVKTMGDSSGIDDQRWILAKEERIATVRGVLRAGKYRRPVNLSPFSVLRIKYLRKRMSAIVRYLWW